MLAVSKHDDNSGGCLLQLRPTVRHIGAYRDGPCDEYSGAVSLAAYGDDERHSDLARGTRPAGTRGPHGTRAIGSDVRVSRRLVRSCPDVLRVSSEAASSAKQLARDRRYDRRRSSKKALLDRRTISIDGWLEIRNRSLEMCRLVPGHAGSRSS